jgi:hypothetical protein
VLANDCCLKRLPSLAPNVFGYADVATSKRKLTGIIQGDLFRVVVLCDIDTPPSSGGTLESYRGVMDRAANYNADLAC